MTQPNAYPGCRYHGDATNAATQATFKADGTWIWLDEPEEHVEPERVAFVTQEAADAKARRAFHRGLVIGGCFVAALAYAGGAWAGDTASWMGTGCQLVPVADQPHVAEVRCRNVSTSGSSYTAGDMVADGLTVNVAIIHGPGDVPDNFTITPMPGFYADPASLTLDENSRGVALIYQWVGS